MNNTRRTHFKKGVSPWNKGKSGVQVSWAKGKKFTKEHREKLSISHKGLYLGEKHPNWKGGISKNKWSVTSPDCKLWRAKVFERDNWTCQTCSIRGCYLEAHHIKSWANYPELRFDIDNGVTLCKDCHKLTNNYKGKNNKKYDKN